MSFSGILRMGAVLASAWTVLSAATFSVTPTNDPNVLANAILGPGLVLDSASFIGTANSAGIFQNFTTGVWTNPITSLSGYSNLPAGIILTSGIAPCGAAVYDGSGCSNDLAMPGDASLDAIVTPYQTYDATVLDMTFHAASPSAATAYFNFVFASTEYPVWVNSVYNDVFAFILNGTNIATIPGTSPPVAIDIDSVNVGNPTGTAASNPDWFTQYSVAGVTPFNWGGSTRVFQLSFPLASGANHIKLAIADSSDPVLDSAVLIQSGTFSTSPSTPDDDVIPEPGTLALMGAGAAAVLLLRRRRTS